MFKNCFYESRKSILHLWETKNGKDIYESFHWVPFVFNDDETGTISSITGNYVSKKTFKTYSDYYFYCADNLEYENKVLPEIQFLTEKYYSIDDDKIDVPRLKTFYIDIEIHSEDGTFPKVKSAEYPIVLISIYDIITNKTKTFGLNEYNGKYKGQDFLSYVHCKNEEALLISFFNYIEQNQPDVLSGYNVMFFDLSYLINRSKRVFGEDTKLFKKLSPLNIVRTWENKENKENMNIDIAGVTILDYMDLIKWYYPTKLERYTLDFVCKHILEKGKVDYSEYEDLRELYHKNWNLYVEYNIIDAYRISQLEEKLGYIKLVQALSLLCKTPMKYYCAMTQLIEGLMLTHFRRNSQCAPRFYGGSQETFPAAYVKEPQTGFHEWVIDLDITSSYPTAIITLNMSLETYYGRIKDLTEEQVMFFTGKRQFEPFKLMKDRGIVTIDGRKLEVFNQALEKKLLCVAPCGSVFSTKKTGVIAEVEKRLFDKRIDVKSKMNKMKKSLGEIHSDDKEGVEKRIDQYHSLQHALKIVLNAMFGVTSVPYSRYFNINIAEAITSCGRQTVKAAERYTNELLNDTSNEKLLTELGKITSLNITKKDKIDFVIYGDTDSLFINIDRLMKEYLSEEYSSIPSDILVKHISELSKMIEEYINDRAYKEIQRKAYNSSITDFKIKFKQEIIARSALFIKKKKYSLWHVMEEGVPVDRIKTTGLEIIRSETPEMVRPMLRELMEMILKKSSDVDIAKKINENKKILKSALPEELAVNIGLHDIEKYRTEEGKSAKGAPWHVKGAINYRRLIADLNLEKLYEDVVDGNKVKVVYVKKNQFGYETIAFNRWPVEFNKYIQIDISKMIEKTFLKKISTLLEPMNKVSLLDDEGKHGILEMFF